MRPCQEVTLIEMGVMKRKLHTKVSTRNDSIVVSQSQMMILAIATNHKYQQVHPEVSVLASHHCDPGSNTSAGMRDGM